MNKKIIIFLLILTMILIVPSVESRKTCEECEELAETTHKLTGESMEECRHSIAVLYYECNECFYGSSDYSDSSSDDTEDYTQNWIDACLLIIIPFAVVFFIFCLASMKNKMNKKKKK